ncbi:MFS transporter [Aureimonas sp. ME7]|uniref:MFS transporter n=1 Tax=Aureimonas sp. ME7 TaxID=2744252 RepID=UPI001AEE666F|nr:MFS transporter [Aureimonas sp. ME7]
MGGVTLLLLAFGRSVVATGIMLALWGVMNTAMSVIFLTWMAQNVDDAPEAWGSLMVAAIQTAIILGAVLGGLLLDGFSIQATFIGSIALGVAALLLIRDGRSLLRDG